MNTADMAEELAHRQADRWGNRLLTRGPDPDRVAHHLATGEQPVSKMSKTRRDQLADAFRKAAKVSDQAKSEVRVYLRQTGQRDLNDLINTQDAKVFEAAEAWIARYVPPVETLTPPAERDGFVKESPIRAFTDFQVAGLYAIGKGFRPSLTHLAEYIDAMHKREGWLFVQVILPDNDAGDPALIFRREAAMPLLLDVPAVEPRPDLYARIAARLDEGVSTAAEAREAMSAPYGNDPINPKHYDGTACAEIGELLTANAYQVLKYCWRLGKKDDPAIELGKGLWYGEREWTLIGNKPVMPAAVVDAGPEFLQVRLGGQSTFTTKVAEMLWHGYSFGMNQDKMTAVLQYIAAEKGRIETAPGSAL